SGIALTSAVATKPAHDLEVTLQRRSTALSRVLVAPADNHRRPGARTDVPRRVAGANATWATRGGMSVRARRSRSRRRRSHGRGRPSLEPSPRPPEARAQVVPPKPHGRGVATPERTPHQRRDPLLRQPAPDRKRRQVPV